MSAAKEFEALILDPVERARIAKVTARRAYEEAVAITAERHGAIEEREAILKFLRSQVGAVGQWEEAYALGKLATAIVNGEHLK